MSLKQCFKNLPRRCYIVHLCMLIVNQYKYQSDIQYISFLYRKVNTAFGFEIQNAKFFLGNG
jgi:hypothetical protein